MKFLDENKKKLAIGLMSGTSLDGIDAALVEIQGKGTATSVRTIAFDTYPYESNVRQFILKNSQNATASLDDICRLNFLLGELFADAVVKIARKGKTVLSAIDFIGSHGQTIHHLSSPKKIFERIIRSTLQIGEPSVIAKRTGILTVGDFRVADVALGGTGAPLVPYVDYCLFHSQKVNRVLLNIGGIANVTVLPKNADANTIIAFDTGAGNMVVDALMQKFYSKQYDENGNTSAKGKISLTLLRQMESHLYVRKTLPKSAGREEFGETFVEKILHIKEKHTISEMDCITTATYFTAWGIAHQLQRFVVQEHFPEEIIISGGGMHNTTMMKFLQELLPSVEIVPIDNLGISGDAKEAIAFAILANETLCGNTSNLPSVTGATKKTLLGKICLP